MENKLVEERWKTIKQPKVLVAVITSEGNFHCQNSFLGRALFLHGYYDLIIFENSDTQDNYKKLKYTTHNMPHAIIKRGVTGFDTIGDKICANRNLVLKYVRKHKEYDYVLMLDSDIFPPFELIPNFLKRKKLDVQSAVCWIELLGQKQAAWNFFKDDIANGNASKWLSTREPKMIKICESGLGCVLFKTDMLKKHKKLNFYNRTDKKNAPINEDLTFTNNLREKGHDIWLDLQTECAHIINK